MSFQEKNITVSLVSFTLILGFFLIRLFQIIQDGGLTSTDVFRLWGIIIVLAIIVTIVATILTHIVSAIIQAIKTGEKEPEIEDIADERDKLIDLRGTKVTYSVSSLGVFISMLTFASWSAAIGDVHLAHLLWQSWPRLLAIFQDCFFIGGGSKMSKCLVSNNIRKLRFFHDEMTQKELAEKVSVTRQTIVAIEKAKYSPSLELAFRIALVFDEPLTAVFSYDLPEDTE